MDAVVVVLVLVVWAVSLWVFYLIIKAAVKNGINESTLANRGPVVRGVDAPFRSAEPPIAGAESLFEVVQPTPPPSVDMHELEAKMREQFTRESGALDVDAIRNEFRKYRSRDPEVVALKKLLAEASQ
jgi:hypothetical protein